MAPLPETNTPRLFVDYEGQMGKHVMQFRFPSGVNSADAVAAAATVINAMKPMVHTSQKWTGARWAVEGSTITLPVAWTAISGTGTTAPNATNYPVFISFIGRSELGRRVRLFVYGTPTPPDADYRSLYADSANVANVINALRASSPRICAVDKAATYWKDYANMGFNAYFQRKRRLVA